MNLATKNKYNSILIIINKLIKYLYIIVCKKKFITKQLRYIVLNQLIRCYNISKKLINNELDLFKNVKVFLVFYILLLKSTNSITFL